MGAGLNVGAFLSPTIYLPTLTVMYEACLSPLDQAQVKHYNFRQVRLCLKFRTLVL